MTLEACPPGSGFCQVRGGSFCVTHEATDPHVMLALKMGAQVYEVGHWPTTPQPGGRMTRKQCAAVVGYVTNNSPRMTAAGKERYNLGSRCQNVAAWASIDAWDVEHLACGTHYRNPHVRDWSNRPWSRIRPVVKVEGYCSTPGCPAPDGFHSKHCKNKEAGR